MSEPLVTTPPGGWTTDDLDSLPVSNYRYELTDGALSVAPSPSNLHQSLGARLFTALEDVVPPPYVVAMAVEVRFGRQLTHIPDLVVVRGDEPGRHWFAPSEVVVAVEIESPGNHVEDRTTKPALYAQFGIPYYWRLEPVLLATRTDPVARLDLPARPRRRLRHDGERRPALRRRTVHGGRRPGRPAPTLGSLTTPGGGARVPASPRPSLTFR